MKCAAAFVLLVSSAAAFAPPKPASTWTKLFVEAEAAEKTDLEQPPKEEQPPTEEPSKPRETATVADWDDFARVLYSPAVTLEKPKEEDIIRLMETHKKLSEQKAAAETAAAEGEGLIEGTPADDDSDDEELMKRINLVNETTFLEVLEKFEEKGRVRSGTIVVDVREPEEIQETITFSQNTGNLPISKIREDDPLQFWDEGEFFKRYNFEYPEYYEKLYICGPKEASLEAAKYFAINHLNQGLYLYEGGSEEWFECMIDDLKKVRAEEEAKEKAEKEAKKKADKEDRKRAKEETERFRRQLNDPYSNEF